MDLQGLDLKAWLQLLINGKAGATPRRSGEWGQAMSQKCGAGCLRRCEHHSRKLMAKIDFFVVWSAPAQEAVLV